jgi:hypothetical protein
MGKILFFLVLVFFVCFGIRNYRRAMQGDDLSILPRVEDEFRTLVIENAVPALCFDGRTAEIVDERREGIFDSGSYTLRRIHRFARNGHGEYFYFVSEGVGTPLFKHLSHINAEIALGKKYVAPSR